MTNIYFALIIFPILFITAMGIMYSSSLAEFNVQLLKVNCPYPIFSGNATVFDITASQNVLYTVDYGASDTPFGTGNTDASDWGSQFICFDANAGIVNATAAPTVTVAIKNYGATFFDVINYGWFVYAADSMTTFFDKIAAATIALSVFINAPAEVLSIPEYTYVNAILIFFVGLGGFMVIRG